MPWTLSHPAAVLPLRRFSPWPLDFTALVVGSMASDLGYYIDRFDLATFTHTLPGSIIAGLPSGVILLLFFCLICRPVCYAFPRPHRQVLFPLCPTFASFKIQRCPIILLSLLIGIWTHNFWDAFTHESGWFVQRLPWLRQTVLPLASTTLSLPFTLQVLSTFVGFAILAAAYFVWLRRQHPRLPADSESDRWRYLFWTIMVAGSLAISLPMALHFAASRHGVLFVRAVMFRTAIYAPAIAVPLSLIATSVIYARRHRAA